MENRSENRYRSETVSCAKHDAFQNRCNFDISISTMFPANNSFHRAAVLEHPECMSRVKYASPIYTRISARAISRSLTKQKFMDSVEFSSPFHRLVEHARRRRGRCNSCSNFTSKPAAESKLKFAMASLYRPAARSYEASNARDEDVLHC